MLLQTELVDMQEVEYSVQPSYTGTSVEIVVHSGITVVMVSTHVELSVTGTSVSISFVTQTVTGYDVVMQEGEEVTTCSIFVVNEVCVSWPSIVVTVGTYLVLVSTTAIVVSMV